MISFDSRYFNNAHRISDGKLSALVTELHDGQWLMRNGDGEFIIHDGSLGKKGYLTISSKYGNPVNNIGKPITEPPSGRDNVTSTGKVSVLIGPYRLSTDRYEVGVYEAGDPLKISANGNLEPCDFKASPSNYSEVQANVDEARKIVAHVYFPPASVGGTMMIVHE